MLEYHPIANLFPLIEGSDFAELVGDIYENGLQEKIVLHGGKILDGRNRYRALVSLDRFDRFRDTIDFDHLAFTHAAPRDPLTWVLSKNLRRRHLSESQRAMVAAKLETYRHGGDRKTQEDQDANLHLDRKAAADTLQVSPRSVASAAKVLGGAPELADAVEKGSLSVSAAADLTGLSVDRQKEIIRNADPVALYAVIKEERTKKQVEKKARREAREADLAARQRQLPDKRYGVILADPEWRFEPYSRQTGMDRSPDNHYPTSELADIKARDVAAIAAPDCVLLLWATAPMLLQALEVMAIWGFSYKSHAVWGKDRIGTGYWFRSKHELLLLGTRGDVPCPAMGDQWESLVLAPVGRHSEKPDFGHGIAEAYFPNLPKIELNARVVRPGWDAWGLEAPGDAEAYALALSINADRFGRHDKASAEPLLKLGRAAGVSPYQIAQDIGHPSGTIKTWLNRLGLTDINRMHEVNAQRAQEWSGHE